MKWTSWALFIITFHAKNSIVKTLVTSMPRSYGHLCHLHNYGPLQAPILRHIKYLALAIWSLRSDAVGNVCMFQMVYRDPQLICSNFTSDLSLVSPHLVTSWAHLTWTSKGGTTNTAMSSSSSSKTRLSTCGYPGGG